MSKHKNTDGRRNAEGYLDLTAFLALKNIEREEKELTILVKPSKKSRKRRRRKAKGGGRSANN